MKSLSTVDVEKLDQYYQDLLVIKNILKFSPPASAIQSRTLIQEVIRPMLIKTNVIAERDKTSLKDEIDWFVWVLNVIPISLKSQFQADLHSIRLLGNKVAHRKPWEDKVSLDEAKPIIDRLERFLSVLFGKPFKSDNRS